MSDPHKEFQGKNVLIERKDQSELASKFGMSVEKYSEILGECRRKLFEVRSKRPRPHLDDKVFPNTHVYTCYASPGYIFHAFSKGIVLLGYCILEWACDLILC